MVRKRGLFLIIGAMYLFSGCAWLTGKEIPKNNPEALFRQGYEDYQKGRYEKAIANFQRLKEEYPLSDLVIRAELGIADSNFSMKEYGYAEIGYNDFLNLHPTNEDLPYVMYQVGMCHYKQMLSIDRDQTETLKAVSEFEKLLVRFPSSKFSFLAERLIRECKSRLAEHEYYVGKLYYKMKHYKAAMRRFENLSKNYPNLGLDYKVNFLIGETRKQLAKAEGKDKPN